jgi:hypothetical protein
LNDDIRVDGMNIEALLAAMAPPTIPAEAFVMAPKLRQLLSKLDRYASVATLAGLMSDLRFQANTIRLDWAVRLTLSTAQGRRKLRRAELNTILNEYLVAARVNRLEDPIEDFFVEPIPTPRGDFLILSGCWEKAAAHTENILRAFSALPDGEPKSRALQSAYALLRLSDSLVGRSGLSRRQIGEDTHQQLIELPFDARLKSSSRRPQFSWVELDGLGIDPADLRPFILSEVDADGIAERLPGESALEFRPLVSTARGILVAAPANISTAVRALLIDTAVSGSQRKSLCYQMLVSHARIMQESGFLDVRGALQPIGDAGLMHHGFYEISTGRYVHVIQIADGFADWPYSAFGSVVKHSPEIGDAIVQSIRAAKSAMERLDKFAEGMTLLLLGGWGGGRSLVFDRGQDLADWLIISMEPADAAVLGACEDGKVVDLWRMHKQLALVEAQGFEFFATNGLLNLFHWWRYTQHALVPPHATEITPPLAINFDTNLLLEARREGLHALDRRAVLHPSGEYHLVSRLEPKPIDGERQAIYASIDAVRRGRMLGVILHNANAWWLELLNNPKQHDLDNAFETWKAATKWLALLMPAFLGSFRDDPSKSPFENVMGE